MPRRWTRPIPETRATRRSSTRRRRRTPPSPRDVAFCQTQDAVLCDDFDRPNGDFLVVGGVWQGPYSSGPDNPHAELYNDAFHTVWPNASRAPDSVYLRSFRQDTTAAKWYLDFDLTGTAVTTSTLDPVYVVIAAMEFDYDGGVNGLLSDTYQLLLGTDNSAKIVLQQTTDAGPLPPLPVAQSAQGDQFLLEAAQPVTCRIEMIVYTRGPQTSNATAICPGPGGRRGHAGRRRQSAHRHRWRTADPLPRLPDRRRVGPHRRRPRLRQRDARTDVSSVSPEAADARAKLAAVAAETVEICHRGDYRSPTGARVSIGEHVARAVAGTRLYTPGELADARSLDTAAALDGAPSITVTDETTAAAARRLATRAAQAPVAALNFASALKPGGGFLTGAKAQEEDLARVSALHETLNTQPAYYEANRSAASALYTDHLIYSPSVPLLPRRPARVARGTVPRVDPHPRPRPMRVDCRRATSRRTCAPPSNGEPRRSCESPPITVNARWCSAPGDAASSATTRARWADVFARLLASPPLDRAFAEIVFAVYDRSETQATRRAFTDRFAG